MRRLVITAVMILLIGCGAGAESRLSPDHPVPQYIQWLLEIARDEIGYTESSSGYTKYGEWAGDPHAEWCAEFLCWCVDQVDQQHGTHLLNRMYPRYSGTNTGLNWFLREGRYVARTGFISGWGSQWYTDQDERMPSSSYVPQPGDWVFYTFDDSGNTAHVAMVEYCTLEDNGSIRVHTIEGNMPDRVQRAGHLLNDWRVLGYGTVRDVAGIVLTSNSSGEKVLSLQRQLVTLGYLDSQYMTGIYGSSTAQAVREFQADTDKDPTGIANRHTQLLLSRLYWQAYWQDDSNFTVHE